jgi:hypothetical protein
MVAFFSGNIHRSVALIVSAVDSGAPTVKKKFYRCYMPVFGSNPKWSGPAFCRHVDSRATTIE